MEKKFIDLLTNLASLFLKVMRGVNDQRILGFVAISIGILSIWQPIQVIYTTIPAVHFMQQTLNIDTRIFTDLMIITGGILLLSKDISSRWFLASTIPLQIYVITSFMNSRSTSTGFVVGDVVIGILIYRQIIKLTLLEIINSYNRGEELNAEYNIGSVDSTSNSWFTGNFSDNTKRSVTSDNPVDQEQS